MKKSISILLSICILFSVCFSQNIFAFALPSSGACNDDKSVLFSFDASSGKLLISGNGNMSDYTSGKTQFKGNEIKSIVIEDGVTGIGDYAFESCSEVTSVEIANSVTHIGSFAFKDCNKLSNITLSDNLERICKNAFANTAYYNKTDNWYSYVSDDKVLYSVLYIDSCLIEFKAEDDRSIDYSIKEGTKVISDNAFDKCSNLTKITFPNSVRNIGDYAFSDCSALAEIKIPNSVENIGSHAFFNCKAVTSLTFGNKVENIGDYAFSDCSALAEIKIPNSVESIGSHAFFNCKAVTSLTLGNKVESIGSWAFRGCKKVLSLIIPESVKYVGENAFYACSGLNKIQIHSIEKWCGIVFENLYANPVYYTGNLYFGDEPITDLVIPEGVEGIGNYSFYKCNSLKSIKIPKTVTSIGNSAFKLCSGLKSILMAEGLISIGSSAFSDCSVLAEIKIPNSVTSIGDSAFKMCSELEYAKLSENLKTIENELFYCCSSLKSIAITDKVTSIGKYAFYDCIGLSDVEIPENTVPSVNITIDDYSFSGCKKLKRIGLTNRVTEIGEYAFYGCSSLKSVGMPKGLTSIEDGVFFNCKELTRIEVPSGVNRIGYYAFSNCDSLKDVYYCGSLDEWRTISIEQKNDQLKSATVHYNFVPCVSHIAGEAVKENIVAATYDKEGSYDEVVYCTVCSEAISIKTVYVEKIKIESLTNAKVSGIKNKTFKGKSLTQSITVKLNGKTLKKDTDYKVTYKDNKSVGKATVTITGINAYSGTITKTFKINPKGTTLSKVTAGSKSLTATWKKQATQTTGYQIQYSTDKNFKKGNKTVTVSKNGTTSKTVSKLKAKKKYYVRIRTYKNVSGTKYYSSWSKAKSVTTKK